MMSKLNLDKLVSIVNTFWSEVFGETQDSASAVLSSVESATLAGIALPDCS